MVVTQQNIKDLSRIATRLRGNGIHTLFLSNLLPVSPNQKEQTLYPGKEPDELRQFRAERLQKVLLDKIRCSVPKFEIQTERFCEFVEQKSLVVRWDGAVSPCYRFLHSSVEYCDGRRKDIKAATFGNLTDKSLLEIWNNRDYAWFRYQVHNSIYPSCIDCQLKDGCQFIKSTESDCWGNENSCSDCLWARGIIRCP
jgi:radical SAM protein with 4Fe4S-binding SPASM domain